MIFTKQAALQNDALTPLPLSAIQPKGWLRDQLKIQAKGFTGLLPEYWEPLGKNSGWLGGTGESWERGPYYLDGLIPLAYLLRDDTLIRRAQTWIEWTLSSQKPDGMFGPSSNQDWWPRMVMLKALMQYESATGDPRVVPFMLRYMRHMHAHLDNRPLTDWGQARGGEAMVSAIWLYRRTGEPFLLQLVEKLHVQTINWTDIFNRFPYWRYQTRFDHRIHVVNVSMALKEPALYGLISAQKEHQNASENGIDALMRYHGQLNGTFSGDEWLAGTAPTQGTELCAVVEYLYTLQTLYAVGGQSALFDKMERVAFNALPATISEDWMTHQYVQQVNQIACNAAHRNWTENRDDANMFGLEPNFGCCTANMHQGWPKFAASLWQQVADGAYRVSSYAPCEVRISPDASFLVDSDYPFDGNVIIRFRGVERPVSLQLRKPVWCDHMTVEIGGTIATCTSDFHNVECVFTDGKTIRITLPMIPYIEKRANDAVGVFCGPILFSLPLQGRWWRRSGSLPFVDYEVFLADGQTWNYALRIDPKKPQDSIKVVRGNMEQQPFQMKNPPIQLHVHAVRCPEWQEAQHSAGELPFSPVNPHAGEVPLILMPYGGCKLRVTEMPYFNQETPDAEV